MSSPSVAEVGVYVYGCLHGGYSRDPSTVTVTLEGSVNSYLYLAEPNVNFFFPQYVRPTTQQAGGGGGISGDGGDAGGGGGAFGKPWGNAGGYDGGGGDGGGGDGNGTAGGNGASGDTFMLSKRLTTTEAAITKQRMKT